MELFPSDPSRNLLPCDGLVQYHGPILSHEDAQHYFGTLLNTIDWQHDEVTMFGKRIVTARKVAWYADSNYDYKYSGSTKKASKWTPELRELKQLIEKRSGDTFNSCLLNLYHNGEEAMGWHADDEKELAYDAPIASVSLGAEREFRFKHKKQPDLKTSVLLENGSLLLMKGQTQTHWLHCLVKSKRVTTPRINLTFRTIARS